MAMFLIPTLHDILAAVCDDRGLSIEQLRGPSRVKELRDAREEYAVFARSFTRCSLQQIGNVINRNHASVYAYLNPEYRARHNEQAMNRWYRAHGYES